MNHDRYAMLGIRGASYQAQAGHIMTPREHICGEFLDSEQTPKGHES